MNSNDFKKIAEFIGKQTIKGNSYSAEPYKLAYRDVLAALTKLLSEEPNFDQVSFDVVKFQAQGFIKESTSNFIVLTDPKNENNIKTYRKPKRVKKPKHPNTEDDAILRLERMLNP